MSDIMNLGLNDWVTCPFDPVHRLKYSRFHNHFVKCQRNHPNDRRKQCPYNATELIEPDKMEDHEKKCRFKVLFAKNNGNAYNIPDYDAPSRINLVDPNKPIRPVDEDSDEEIDSVSLVEDNINKQFTYIHGGDYNERYVQKKMEFPLEKRGFGRGIVIRESLEPNSQTTSSFSATAPSSQGRGAFYAKYHN